VVCIQGDHDLGGRNWDELVVTYLSEEWKQQHPGGDDPLSSPETLQELFKSAEEAKRLLSRMSKAPVRVSHNGLSARVELTREKFESLTVPLLERTLSLTRDVAAEARNLGTTKIDRILLVGGSSYMPQVQERLKAEFPDVTQQLFEPEQAVAKGAAIYASNKQIQDAYEEALMKVVGRTDLDLEMLPPETQKQVEQVVRGRLPGKSKQALEAGLNMEIVNVCSKSFGLVVKDDNDRDVVAYLIKRNSPVPAEREDTFGTYAANQPNVLLRIIEAEEPNLQNLPALPDDARCRQIKEVTLNLPSGLPKDHPVEVKYSLSEDGGRLRVQARDPKSGQAIDDNVDTFDAISPKDLQQARDQTQNVEVQS
jgi:molecular chaperone DnaK (HSP70)